jgi:hypothetical protein
VPPVQATPTASPNDTALECAPTGFVPVPVAAGHALAIAAWADRPALRAALEDLLVKDTVADLPRMATTRRSVVGRLEVDGLRLVVKRYHEPGLFLLRAFFRASRARREVAALEVVSAVVPNPVRPVAWAERRVAGFRPRSLVVTTEMLGASSLRALRHLAGPEREAVRALVLEQLPAKVAALHAARIVAWNLHAKNVLVDPAARAIGFIDLPAAAVHPRIGPRERVHDLACLWKELRHSLDAADMQRFLADYARALGGPDDPADLAVRVAARADTLDNRTPLAGVVHGLRKRLKRTRLGELLTGHRYDDERGRAP